MKVLFLLLVACALTLLPVNPASAGAGPTGQVTVIQAAPGMSVDLAVDGTVMSRGVGLGKVLGPYKLTPGPHVVRFTQAAGGAPVTASLKVRSGSNSDVVLHLPAARGGRPVVNSYQTPLQAIGPGKARLLLAHTATVAPADVEFDGKTVFRNIANGEFAQAEVPAGDHRVALTATGVTAPPILGPLDVTLVQRTVTMVYAVGTPSDGSMKVITHTVTVAANGAVVPNAIKTGTAGLAAGIRVLPFSATRAPSAAPAIRAAPARWLPQVLRVLRPLAGTDFP